MSSTEEAPELKGGHPPAVKVGGMRVSQHKPSHPEKAPEVPKKESNEADGEEAEGDTAEVAKKAPEKVVVSGAVAKGNADFPAEAVKVFHEKPVPTRQPIHNPNVGNITQVHQPRKNNN